MGIRLAVIIKALNEERHIARAIESAIAAVSSYSGQVILADSGSTDGTIAIASGYPIKIVQLEDTSERSCGVGAQMGYQFLNVDYVYLLDGDMALTSSFLTYAVDILEHSPSLAGVGGMVEELGGGNYEFNVRKEEQDGRFAGRQESLDMGGLYRVEAIKKINYLTNRNLHSYEEKELGQRLTQAGYFLERIAEPAIKHYGKTEDSLQLLFRRWETRHIDGPGEWMRAVWRTPHFFSVAMKFRQFWVIFIGWLSFAMSLALVYRSSLFLAVTLFAHGVLLLRLAFKRKSFGLACTGFIHLQFYTAGMIRGLFRKQVNPSQWINANVRDGSVS
ncbi:glycosyltransferase family 2 protein [Glaciimonas sp. PAMC28666]|uniref:glycosyltransferase n=1 Tax=Glaciimonas sp. PAMC28666 TaxID=2807626 RepID=UPI001964D9A5|nr:glycosyltransferase [Glaciimonas sp. PAMC28666]QRX82862.1 glycosyltransferase [Glaciimonas sp. PAMC28666]